jgi:hypothetical protein
MMQETFKIHSPRILKKKLKKFQKFPAFLGKREKERKQEQHLYFR